MYTYVYLYISICLFMFDSYVSLLLHFVQGCLDLGGTRKRSGRCFVVLTGSTS